MNLTHIKNKLQSLKERGLVNVKENIQLSEYSSFRIGGPSDLVVHPKSAEGLMQVVKLFKEEGYH